MSLVNKMLRDLDARHAASGERAGLPSAVTPLAARLEPARGRGVWLTALALLVIGIVAAGWFVFEAPQPPAVATSVASAPPPVPLPASSPAAAPPAKPAETGALKLAVELAQSPAPRAAAKAEPAAGKQKSALPPAPLPRPPVVALPRELPAPAAQEPRIDKQARQATASERAEAEYRRGVLSQRQGQVDEAVIFYHVALAEQPEHAAARQTLASLLIELKRFDEAEEVLKKGTELSSARLASTLALARLKVERGQAPAALDLLLRNADAGERSADYQGFMAALLHRSGRQKEAIDRYQAAIRLAPNEGRWWAGLGITLDAEGKAAEAREAYQKARGLPGVPPELTLHIDQRLR